VLAELTVRDLGVIDDLTLLLGEGMTALTGETGAGKTLVVEAIDLLVGGRPDAAMVRPGATEAWVEGRFVTGDGEEVVIARAVPASGRSRAYVDGRMAPVSALAEWGARLIDLHGQHDHQSLLAPAVQRAALDAHGGVDRGPLEAARRSVRDIDEALAALGGDARSRAREVDLLRFQVTELDAAALADAGEEAVLEAREDVLGEAGAWREAAASAREALVGDGGAAEGMAAAIGALRARRGAGPFAEVVGRLEAAAADLVDAAADVRTIGEGIEDDPGRLAEVQARRALLRELRRKYGESLGEVIDYARSARERLAELEAFDARAATLDAQRGAAEEAVAAAAAEVARRRRVAAPGLARAIEANLRHLALPRARFEVAVGGDDPADDVAFGIGANPGEPVLPLAKVASGGELARTMLAVRLVLTSGPPTLVFDEVDAGIGGEAAVAVGRALARVSREPGHQVLVVTHLAQVAAFADRQVAVAKGETGGRTVAQAVAVAGDDRVRELSRMLSGRPDSGSAREHATEILEAAAAERGLGAAGGRR
jgi:DNA repair protein RecN (Recombination protein N)